MRRHFRNTAATAALVALCAGPLPAFAQAVGTSPDDPRLADLGSACKATIALLAQTPGLDIATMSRSEIRALEPGARKCVRTAQKRLNAKADDPAAAAAADAEDGTEIVTPEAQAEALTGEDPAAPATGEAAEPSAESAPGAAAEALIGEEPAAPATGEAAEHSAQAAPDAAAEGAGADAPAGEAAAEPPADAAPVTAGEAAPAAEPPAGQAAPQDDTAVASGEDASGEDLEVVQEDTELATEAANELISTAAAAAATSDKSEATGEAQAASEEPAIETEVVTEETSRSSDEEFATAVKRKRARAQADDDDGLEVGQIAAGVIGGLVLGELLRPDEEVVEDTGDRVVVERPNGEYYVMKDDNALLRQPGTRIETQTFSDGSTRQIAYRENGTRVETIRAANGQVLRRAKYTPDGREVLLFDDTADIAPVEVSRLPAPVIERVDPGALEEDALRQALAAEEDRAAGRRFSLAQIRNIRAVRNLVPIIELENVTFDSGSAAIRPSEAEELAAIGRAMRDTIAEYPDEVYLIEGHTDAVGGAAMNLALSDRRAESVALALTEYFDVPPENMVIQGYGESNLRIPTSAAERENRRAAVRRITPLLQTAAAN